jgi:hypothetical protein
MCEVCDDQLARNAVHRVAMSLTMAANPYKGKSAPNSTPTSDSGASVQLKHRTAEEKHGAAM